jgi:RHS repeat-associated protein
LYNGNVWYWTSANQEFSTTPIQLHAYRYDQLNRITKSSLLQTPDLTNNSWTGGFSNNYASNYAYDPNGNLTQLHRREGSGSLLDQLTYHYDSGTNRLNHIDDSQTTAYPLDLEDQENDNYTYDAKGRLATDDTEQIDAMEWMPNDRLKSINQNGQEISFQYDAHGQRVLKQSNNQTTYYVRDDIGNILAVYGISDGVTTWNYTPILAGDRLGTFSPNETMDGVKPDTIIQQRGKRLYELANHLGTVQALVSDRKVPTASSEFSADVRHASDFYPFGMLMPGRRTKTQDYAYGFHGLESDDEVKGEGNSYTTEFRQYDPRVSRWLSTDQVFKAHESVYAAFANNPVNYLDQNGLDTSLTITQYQELMMETTVELYGSNFDFRSRLNRIMAVQRSIDELIQEINSNPEYDGSEGIAIAIGIMQIRSQEGPGLDRDLRYVNEYVQLTIQDNIGPFRIVDDPEPEMAFEPPPPPVDYPTIGPQAPGVRPMTAEEMAAIRDPGANFRRDLGLLRNNVFGAATYLIGRHRGLSNREAMNRAHVVGGIWDLAVGMRRRTPSPTNLVGSSHVDIQTTNPRGNYTIRPSN